MTFKVIPLSEAPRKIKRKLLAEIREQINEQLRTLGEEECLLVEGYSWNILNALRRYYLKYGYPNTCMRKKVLYISK